MSLSASGCVVVRDQEVTPAMQTAIESAAQEAVREERRRAATADSARVEAAAQRAVQRVLSTGAALGSRPVPAPGAGVLEQAAREAEVRLTQQRKEHLDALIQDAVRIASDAQAWKLKPAAFGGGAGEEGFASLTFEQMGYRAEGTRYENRTGTFALVPFEDRLRIVGSASTYDHRVVVTVSGTGPEDLALNIRSTEE